MRQQMSTATHGTASAGPAGGEARSRLRVRLRLVVAAAMLTGVVGIAQPAHAAGPDINGGKISWDSHIPCSDGGAGVSVSAHGYYAASNSGYYRLRYALERSDGGVIAYSPVRDWTLSAASTTNLRFPTWYASFSYTGEAHAVAYAFKWNGSSYALVARETVPCL